MKRLLDHAVDAFLAALLLGMTLVVAIQVFFRYVVNSPLAWPEETARIMIVWLSFVGAYMAMRENKHIGFGLLVERLPAAGQAVVEIAAKLCMILFLLVMTVEGFAFAAKYADVPMPYTDVSTGLVVYSVFPVSGALMLLQSLLDLPKAIGKLRQPAGRPEEGRAR